MRRFSFWRRIIQGGNKQGFTSATNVLGTKPRAGTIVTGPILRTDFSCLFHIEVHQFCQKTFLKCQMTKSRDAIKHTLNVLWFCLSITQNICMQYLNSQLL